MNFEKTPSESLVQRLRAMLEQEKEKEHDHERLLHDLQVHQVELEEQNRDLRDAQNDLEASRNRYAELYDSAPISYFTFDSRGCVLEANLTAATLVGRDRQLVIGMPFLALVRMEEPGLFWEHLRRAARTGGPVLSELSFSTLTAARVHVEAVSTPVLGAGGDQVGLRTAFTDITELKRAQTEREAAWATDRSQRQQLERIDQAMVMVSRALTELRGSPSLPAVLQVIVEQARTVVDCDYAVFGTLGQGPDASPCAWFSSGLDPVTAAGIGRLPTSDGLLGSALREGQTLRLADLRAHPSFRGFPAHHPQMTSFLGVPVRYGEKVLGNLCLANRRDATAFSDDDQRSAEMLAERVGIALEIARLQDVAHDAVLARDNLLAVVSHDLRTPLSVIASYATLLMRTPPLGDRRSANKQLGIIRRAAELVNGLVEDLLQAAAIEAGHFTVEPRSEDPVRLIDECMEMLGPVVAAKGLRFERDVPASLPRVHCDARRVLQVFSNLIGNAAKFTPEGGRIRVQATPQAGEVLFAVSDSGSGIPKSKLPRLFDRYWRGDSRGWEGAGLGLYIARTIIESHGGRIWVESTPGAGSTFFFTLALEPVEARGGPEPSPAPAALAGPPKVEPDDRGRLSGLRVLLVDDEANALTALALLLGDEGLVVSQATSGEQALAAAEAEPPDVVVLDVEMPGMTGLVLLERLRALLPGLPAIIMSGYLPQEACIVEARASTGASYIAKPVDVDALIRMLGALYPVNVQP